MSYETPNTVAEMVEMAAEALAARDEDTLMRLSRTLGNWMISTEEKRALDMMLDSMMEAVEGFAMLEAIEEEEV